MHDVNVDAMDLNLLRVLDALLVERHLTRAANRIGLSQPAMSHALGRLREHLGDPLFVRTPKGLVPTPRAQQLAAPLRTALTTIAEGLAGAIGFEPRTASRNFSVGTADYGAFVLVPKLLERIGREAPGVDLWVRTLADDQYTQLGTGDLDVVIGPLPPRRAGLASIHARLLFEERFVCLVRKDHPRVRRQLDLDTYADLPHAFIALRGTPGGVVDEALAKHGRRRRVALAVPHFLLAPHVIANSDLVLTVGIRVAEAFTRILPLRMVEPPIAIPGFKVQMIWHERHHHDPAQKWLRDRIVESSGAKRR